MLKKFTVSNFKNFKNEFTLDFTRIKNYEFNQECVVNGVVSQSVIYGCNGSGKTNLALAVFDIHNHLKDDKVSKEYKLHYLNAESNAKRANFSYFFQFGENEVVYKYQKSSYDILEYESLIINDKLIFEINWEEDEPTLVLNLGGTENLNRKFKKDSLLISSNRISMLNYIYNNTSENQSTDEYYQIFDHMYYFCQMMISTKAVRHTEMFNSARFLELIEQLDSLENFENFIKSLGVDCKLCIEEINGERLICFDFGDKKVDFFETASTGTISFSYLYLNIILLRKAKVASFPGLIFIDEFDAYYHYKASLSVLKTLKDMKCQFILTTHNTSIMSNDILRPDCYFVMEKDEVKPLHLFTAKELRKAHNIEKMYKAGAFF